MDLWVNEQKGKPDNTGDKDHPVDSVSAALSKIPDGGKHRVAVIGNIQKGIKVSKRKWDNLLILGVISQGKRPLIYGFEGPVIPFDRTNLPIPNWNNLNIMDVHGLHVDNFEVWGGITEGVTLNDSYPEIGINGVELSNLLVRYAAKWGIFSGGLNIQNLTIRDTLVTETCYYQKISEHGIYLSGGGWPGNTHGPMKNIKIKRVICTLSGGRHGLQVNAAADGVEIEDSVFFLNQLGGISLIGCKNVKVRGNQIAMNHRAGITLYNYKYCYDFNDPESVEEYKRVMVKMENILIEKNTIVVGPKTWTFDKYHHNTPANQPCIAVNNKVNKAFYWPASNIVVQNNVLCNPCNEKMIEFSGTQEAWATYVFNNMMATKKEHAKPSISVPYGSGLYSVEDLEKIKSDMYRGNKDADPGFADDPSHNGPVDMDDNPDWSKDIEFIGNLYSNKAKLEGCGHLARKSAKLIMER